MPSPPAGRLQTNGTSGGYTPPTEERSGAAVHADRAMRPTFSTDVSALCAIVHLLLAPIAFAAGDDPNFRPPDEESTARNIVFLSPLPTVTAVALGGVAAHVTANITVLKDLQVSAEALVLTRRGLQDVFPGLQYDGIFLAGRPVFRRAVSLRWTGFFLPKVIVGSLSRRSVRQPFASAGFSEWIAHGGLDVGVDVRFGRLVLGSTLGLSAGYGRGSRGFLAPLAPTPHSRVDGVAPSWMINLNLIRIGIVL